MIETNNFGKEVELMTKKAANSAKADDAMRFSQAACNAANALITLQNIKLQEQKEQREREKTVAKKTSMRQTGRTTRMLEDAKILARRGRSVYVVGANKAQASIFKEIAGPEARELGIQFESESLLNIDWSTMQFMANPNCVVLVDHSVIESKFGAVLEMLHRYDAKPVITEP